MSNLAEVTDNTEEVVATPVATEPQAGSEDQETEEGAEEAGEEE